MKRFYLLLAAVAALGGALIWYAGRSEPAPGLGAGAPPPASPPDDFPGYTLGSDSAPVEVVEYSDFECPFCARFANIQMPAVREQLIATGQVRWRYRDFPLASHRYSAYSAHAAQCAGEQGKFWEMHDRLFADHSWAQTGRNPRGLFRDMARAAGVDVGRYDACMDGQRYAGRVAASAREGEARGVAATPTFFVNGRSFRGPATSDAFKAVVESLIPRRP